jgi:hypothetical protein
MIKQEPCAEKGIPMATKSDLKDWIVEALSVHGGSARIPEVAKHVWENHKAELAKSADLFYTWQYDIRWAADQFRVEHRLQPKPRGDRGPWRLVSR